MADLCTVGDVINRLGRQLDADQSTAAPGCITEASGLVAGYLARDYAELAEVPERVRVVCSRVAARALTGAASNLPPGTTEFGSSLSVMSHTVKLGADTVNGSPWLSRADKTALSPYVVRGRVMNFPMFRIEE